MRALGSIRTSLLLLIPGICCAAADDVPGWLRTLAAETTPAYDSKVPAVDLLRESEISVDESGKIVTTERVAIRVLSRSGAREAHGVKFYLRDTGRVRDVKAWVVPPSGEPRKLPKERFLDVAAGSDSLYEDVRARVIDATKDCDPGAVFGYETVSEEKWIFTQLDWTAQNNLPVRRSTYSLTLSPGWESKTVMLNHAELKPEIHGNTSKWELTDLPYFESEPQSPEWESVVPRLAISIFPSGDAPTSMGPSFRRWEDVSRWMTGLHDPQAVPDAAITDKVKSLTASGGDEQAKIRAIASYVQAIRYVSIQTGIGRGGGYRPHAAALVFSKSYGDCKDKANLLRAMLKAAGVQSWPVSIFSGDPLYVRQEWASPQQFNHCILAIRAPAGMVSDAIIDHPKLGKLLIFDPTDPYTPFGEMPVHEQNSFALIIAGDDGGLVRMPSAKANANSTIRTIEASISPEGAVQGKMHEVTTGWTAVAQRHAFRTTGEQDYRKRIETRVSYGIRSAEISELKAADTVSDGHFTLDLNFASPSYAQLMQRRLMVFRPSILEAFDPLPFNDSKRQYAAVITARSWRDTVTVRLPAGFAVDEMPATLKMDTEFGTYESKVSVDNGVLTFTRALDLKTIVVPAAEYAKLKAFSDRVGGADQAPIVLAKK